MFDSSHADRILTSLPKQTNKIKIDENIIKAIEAVDKKYRQIADTLYHYKSLKHTIFQTFLIETNDSVFINPLSLGDKIHLANIIFYSNSLNIKVGSIAKPLSKPERDKFFEYLNSQFDSFSLQSKKLQAQPVRILYIKFYESNIAQAGLDIYGAHFLWTIDKSQNWDIIKVERLWVY